MSKKDVRVSELVVQALHLKDVEDKLDELEAKRKNIVLHMERLAVDIHTNPPKTKKRKK